LIENLQGHLVRVTHDVEMHHGRNSGGSKKPNLSKRTQIERK